jgi:hypothetical protein
MSIWNKFVCFVLGHDWAVFDDEGGPADENICYRCRKDTNSIL